MNTLREIWRLASLRNIFDLVIFKTRQYITTLLENGHVIPGKKYNDLVYWIGTQRYIVRFPKVRGPAKYHKITTDEGEDITEYLSSYLGPYHNFHGIPTTPQMLGYSNVVFFMKNDTTLSFNGSDIITLS